MVSAIRWLSTKKNLTACFSICFPPSIKRLFIRFSSMRIMLCASSPRIIPLQHPPFMSLHPKVKNRAVMICVRADRDKNIKSVMENRSYRTNGTYDGKFDSRTRRLPQTQVLSNLNHYLRFDG